MIKTTIKNIRIDEGEFKIKMVKTMKFFGLTIYERIMLFRENDDILKY
jgi:hypothetical protein